MPFTSFLANEMLDHTFAGGEYLCGRTAVTGSAATDLFTADSDTFRVAQFVRFTLLTGTPGPGGLIDGGLYCIRTEPSPGVYSISSSTGYSQITFTSNVTGIFSVVYFARLHCGTPGDACTSYRWDTAGLTTLDYVTVAADGTLQNDSELIWTSLPAPPSGWTQVTHVSLWDQMQSSITSPVYGNALAYGSLSAPRNVFAGDNLTIEAGELVIGVE